MKKLLAVASAALYLASSVAFAKDKPNILIIFPDDVGWQNVSAYGLGTMGYKTPNIDKHMRPVRNRQHIHPQMACRRRRRRLAK